MSPVAKVWNGSAWVASNLSGKARTGSFDFAFAPPAGGPAYEGFAWPDPPTLTNGNDSGQIYTMGTMYSLVAQQPHYGVRWTVPTVLTSAPTGGWVASIWKDSDGSLLASKTFNPVGHEGTDLDVLFDASINPPIGQYFIATVCTRDYTFRSRSIGGDICTSPSGNVIANASRLAGTSGNAFPSGTFAAVYYVSPLIGV